MQQQVRQILLPLHYYSFYYIVGTDLTLQTKAVSFIPGQSSAVVNFTIVNDSIPEPDEVFVVGFVKGQNINIGTPSEVELTILGNGEK